MSEISVSGSSPTEETQAAHEQQAAGKPQGNAGSAMGPVGNLGQLKAKMEAEEPGMWNKWMQAMASEITNKWRKFPERLKKIRQESETK